MKTIQIPISNPTGLHTRPAKYFVNITKTFQSDIWVEFGEKKVNAKSLFSLLTLGVKPNQEILIHVDGVDEESAIESIRLEILNGLGENFSAESSIPEQQAIQKTEPSGEKNELWGLPVSPGVVIGKVHVYSKEKMNITRKFTGINEELSVFDQARQQLKYQIETTKTEMGKAMKPEEIDILDAHQEILSDQNLIGKILNCINEENSAVNAWQKVLDESITEFLSNPNRLIRDRAADLLDIREQLLQIMSGSPTKNNFPAEPVIIFAKNLLPSDAIEFSKHQVLGIALAEGSTTDHAAILSRALGIPAVAQLSSRLMEEPRNETIILDGKLGFVNLQPGPKALQEAIKERNRWESLKQEAEKNAAIAAKTVDGHSVEVAANVAGLADVLQSIEKGADGVGLLRTEFLFDKRTQAPTEDEQIQIYSDMITALKGQTIIIRTLDIGGDKPLPFINFEPENNPFLGERGIRLCLREEELFRTQLRAALIASRHGPVRIMFPMIGDLEEWQRAKQILEKIRLELGVKPIEVGIMVEVPSAVWMADSFANEVDFFSIGTNDLTQYTMAIDRTHQRLGRQLDGLHPAVLRQIQHTVTEAHKKGKWVGICGELGADPTAVPVLIGLGVDELSVNVPSIPLVKEQIRKLNYVETCSLAEKVIHCRNAKEVRKMIHAWQLSNETLPL